MDAGAEVCKMGTGALRTVAIEQLRVLTKYSEEDI